MESRFPLEFKECPNCGGTETIEELAWKEDIANGRATEDYVFAVQPTIVPLIDQKKGIGISATVIIKDYVDCGTCGMHYCKQAIKQIAPIKMGKPPPGMQGFGFPQNNPGLS